MAKINDTEEQNILYPARLLMFFSIGECKIEYKDVIFVKLNNKYSPTMSHQQDMYALIHRTHEKSSSRMNTLELKGYLIRRYGMGDHLRIINADHIEDPVCVVVDKVYTNR